MSEIGSNGIAEVNLTIPQGTTLRFTVTHTDADGHAVDHTGSTIKAAIQQAGGPNVADLSPYCTGTATGVSVVIPASVGNALSPSTRYLWDMIASMAGGDVVRLAYGTVSIVDTYALDGE